jgi:hypothetical protein
LNKTGVDISKQWQQQKIAHIHHDQCSVQWIFLRSLMTWLNNQSADDLSLSLQNTHTFNHLIPLSANAQTIWMHDVTTKSSASVWQIFEQRKSSCRDNITLTRPLNIDTVVLL